MAGPVTHIVLALKIIASGLIDTDVKEFIIGTSFPDIRYLGVIERDKTHYKNVTWHDIVTEQSPFYAGLKFHAFVDRIREEYMHNSGIYTFIRETSYRSQCMKVAEDQILYAHCSDWTTITAFFGAIAPEELTFGIQNTDVMRWHKFIQWYCAQPFLDEKPLIGMFVTLSPTFSDHAHDMIELIKALTINSDFKNLVATFYDSFEQYCHD